MLKTYKLSNGRLVSSAEGDNADLYVYVDPDEKEKAYLTGALLVDEHTLNSAFDPDELGRVEFENNHVAAIVKKPKRYTSDDHFFFKVSSVGLFLYSDKLVIVTNNDDFNWDARIFIKMHVAKDIFLRVIFQCVLHFEEHLRVIRKISDELEEEINKTISNKDLLNMFKLNKGLVYYLDAINSNNKVIERLKINSAKLAFDQEENEFIDDLIIECNQCFQQADSYLEVLSSLINSWASIINNNLNIRIRRLTVVSICIMTPTFVVSLFSMNVPLPLPQSGTILSFWVVTAMALMSVLGLLLIGYFKKL